MPSPSTIAMEEDWNTGSDPVYVAAQIVVDNHYHRCRIMRMEPNPDMQTLREALAEVGKRINAEIFHHND